MIPSIRWSRTTACRASALIGGFRPASAPISQSAQMKSAAPVDAGAQHDALVRDSAGDRLLFHPPAKIVRHAHQEAEKDGERGTVAVIPSGVTPGLPQVGLDFRAPGLARLGVHAPGVYPRPRAHAADGETRQVRAHAGTDRRAAGRGIFPAAAMRVLRAALSAARSAMAGRSRSFCRGPMHAATISRYMLIVKSQFHTSGDSTGLTSGSTWSGRFPRRSA